MSGLSDEETAKEKDERERESVKNEQVSGVGGKAEEQRRE